MTSEYQHLNENLNITEIAYSITALYSFFSNETFSSETHYDIEQKSENLKTNINLQKTAPTPVPTPTPTPTPVPTPTPTPTPMPTPTPASKPASEEIPQFTPPPQRRFPHKNEPIEDDATYTQQLSAQDIDVDSFDSDFTMPDYSNKDLIEHVAQVETQFDALKRGEQIPVETPVETINENTQRNLSDIISTEEENIEPEKINTDIYKSSKVETPEDFLGEKKKEDKTRRKEEFYDDEDDEDVIDKMVTQTQKNLRYREDYRGANTPVGKILAEKGDDGQEEDTQIVDINLDDFDPTAYLELGWTNEDQQDNQKKTLQEEQDELFGNNSNKNRDKGKTISRAHSRARRQMQSAENVDQARSRELMRELNDSEW